MLDHLLQGDVLRVHSVTTGSGFGLGRVGAIAVQHLLGTTSAPAGAAKGIALAVSTVRRGLGAIGTHVVHGDALVHWVVPDVTQACCMATTNGIDLALREQYSESQPS